MEQAAANIICVLIGALFMWRIVTGDDDLQPPSRGRQA